MAQSLELNIKTTSDVPQAMDKAKSATVSFSKQVDDVSRKFSTAFKDIAFAFVAPLVILNGIISAISASMEKAKQLAAAGFKTLADGEDQFASAQEARMARFFQQREDFEQKKRESEAGKKATTEKFFEERGFMKSLFERPISTFAIVMGELGIGKGAGMDWIQKNAAADFEKANPNYKNIDFNPKSTDFKRPEGLSNVVGVGANPVMEAMNAQLEEQRKQTALLEKMAGSNTSIPLDYTKEPSTGPSRALLLRGK